MLGHSRPSITLDIYGHLIEGFQSDALDRLDQSFLPTAAQLQRRPQKYKNGLSDLTIAKEFTPDFPSKIV
jgi:hypothetical protein